MAMLPFCGYNMADYFGHWLRMARDHDPERLPRVFLVNWFRKNGDGHFIWPGFGENSRVLEWIFRRCDGEAEAVETPIGLVPGPDSIDTDGLELAPERLAELLTVDPADLREQLPQVEAHLARFGDRLPAEIQAQLEALARRVAAD
jgi:phosphoenolpyruvate carboxykinase (GTP)